MYTNTCASGTSSMTTWLSIGFSVCLFVLVFFCVTIDFAAITFRSSGQSNALQRHFCPHVLNMWDIFALSTVSLMTLKHFDDLPY